jgi:hypothetical protein
MIATRENGFGEAGPPFFRYTAICFPITTEGSVGCNAIHA